MQDDFRFFKLGLASRLALSGGLFAAGAFIEIGLSVPLGLAVAVLGWLPLFLRKASNKPDDQGLEEWRPVPMAEIDKLDDSLRESKKLRRKTSGVLSSVAFLAAVAFLAVIVAPILGDMGRTDIILVLANALVFLAPAALFGRVRVFTPAEIAMKMPCFRAILAEELPQAVAVAPYIRFDKDKSGADVPEDLRIMYELKRSPADLVGVQMQAAINKGPNGEVPYMYAVALTKGKSGASYKIASRLKASGYEVEAGGDDEYGTVVIRQDTGGTGYETKPEDCLSLRGVCLALLEDIAAKA